jgi:hypothetical protein
MIVPKMHSEFYGDETRWFIGLVLDINDPIQLGRVKVRIYGIHTGDQSEISHYDLPWAQVVSPITEGGSSGIGANTGIKPMALVFGLFMDGKNSQMPMILGSLPKFETSRNGSNPTVVSDKAPLPANDSLAAVNSLPAKELDEIYLKDLGSSNAEKAYNYFLSKAGGSFETHQAAGIVGNLIIESQRGGDIQPDITNTTEGSYGIAQWNPNEGAGNRKSELEKYCKNPARRFPIDSLYAQLSFINYELFVVPEDFGLKPLQRSKTVEEAAEIFARKYEKPDKTTIEKRKVAARDFYTRMES